MNVNIALIMAGGLGKRMHSDVPKQFHLLCGKPILLYSLERFENHPLIDEIYIVCNPELVDEVSDLTHLFPKLLGIIEGGTTRRQSVYNGLRKIAESSSDDDIVLIHDAARPLVTTRIIDENIRLASTLGGCTTAIPATDTMLISEDALVQSVPPRHTLYSAQTPQSFKLKLILEAHETIVSDAIVTDDTALMLLMGHPVSTVEGESCNMKLTTPEDLILLEHYRLTKQYQN